MSHYNERIPELTTLCYIEKDGKYLMMHRVKKENDINKDKYIGVGGHFEFGESPDECLLREVQEETGIVLKSYKPRGIVTFIYPVNDGSKNLISDYTIVEYMHLYTADLPDEYGNAGDEKSVLQFNCDEGELVWIDKKDVYGLPIWEGDKIFFRLLEERDDYFSLKLVYDSSGQLIEVKMDGMDL